MPDSEHNAGSKPPRIRVGRVESVDLFEIKDSELELFEHGSPADLQLNFAIFLFSMAFTAFVALETATFTSNTVHTTFIIFTVVGLLFGLYLFLSWRKSHTSSKKVCGLIRERIKELDITITKTVEESAPETLPTDIMEPKN